MIHFESSRVYLVILNYGGLLLWEGEKIDVQMRVKTLKTLGVRFLR